MRLVQKMNAPIASKTPPTISDIREAASDLNPKKNNCVKEAIISIAPTHSPNRKALAAVYNAIWSPVTDMPARAGLVRTITGKLDSVCAGKATCHGYVLGQ